MTQSELAQMARHEVLQRRVEYLMVKAALAKLNAQAPSEADVLLGQRILDGAERPFVWTLGALTNVSIAAGLHEPDGSTITEGDLEFAVNSMWSAFAQ